MRTVLRAVALRQMDAGQSTPEVARNLDLSAKAVWQIGRRYLEGGLERALFEAPRPGKSPVLDQEQRQRIIAVACSPPPEGRARWTVRLLTEEVVRRKLVPRVGRESIRILLESHDLEKQSPRRSQVCPNRPDGWQFAHAPEQASVTEPPAKSRMCSQAPPMRHSRPMNTRPPNRRKYAQQACGLPVEASSQIAFQPLWLVPESFFKA